MRDGNFIEVLVCDLDTGEIAERAADQARTHIQLARHQEEMKEKAAKEKKIEAQMKGRLAELAAAVHTGKEDRPVECAERADVYERSIETVRLDTGEIVRSRRMTEKEKENALQRGLFDEPAKAIADATRKGAAEEREPDEDAVDVDANNAVDHGDPGSIDNPTAPPEAPAAEPEPESAEA